MREESSAISVIKKEREIRAEAKKAKSSSEIREFRVRKKDREQDTAAKLARDNQTNQESGLAGQLETWKLFFVIEIMCEVDQPKNRELPKSSYKRFSYFSFFSSK